MFPLWLKLAWTLVVAVVAAVYWRRYGPGNYLWFSDVALLGSVPALWLESAPLASTLAVFALALELFWVVVFGLRLVARVRLTGLVDYMFDERPLWLRVLSLFHVPLPILLLWLLARLGYDPAGLPAAVVLAWIVLAASYALTDPQKNVNWVFGWMGRERGPRWPPLAWLGLLMLAIPVLVLLPTHLALRAIFDAPG